MRVPTVAAFAFAVAVLGSGAGINIVTPVAPDDPVIVSGLSGLGAMSTDVAPSVLMVYVAHPGDVPPVLGSYAIDGETITFFPRFPFQPGQEYRVVVNNGDASSETTFVIPLEDVDPVAVVDAIYPSASVVPENLLRFYVEFSTSMRGRDAYTSITLFDDAGKVVNDAFVETTPELWDDEMRRLTLICHPGRIKRGLELNRRMGPPLREGHSFTLRVDGMRDATGVPMAERYEKTFVVGPADRISPDPEEWVLKTPRANTSAALHVDLGESMNFVLFDRLMTVMDSTGAAVDGWITADAEETVWLFRPVDVWAPGTYDLAVHVTMEDLAGNRLDMLFDEIGEADAEATAGSKSPLRKIRFVIE